MLRKLKVAHHFVSQVAVMNRVRFGISLSALYIPSRQSFELLFIFNFQPVGLCLHSISSIVFQSFMPGPGRRNPRATRPQPPKPSINDSKQGYITEIDNAEAWDVIVGILCNYFELPGKWMNFESPEYHLK